MAAGPSKKMNCVIVDDDELSRRILEKFVERTGFLALVSSLGSAIEAVDIVNDEQEIDLIFLDIEMPEMTGMEFLRSLNDLPQIIIISAKQKYALEAFEHDVTDYILKPISYPRVYKAVDKAYQKFREEKVKKREEDGFFVKSNAQLVRLKFDDILWVEALENYVGIYTFENKYVIHFTMKGILEKLPSDRFSRVHRSYIVNLNKIDVIEDSSIIMKRKNETKIIPIGKSYRDQLMNDINLFNK